MDKTAIFTIQSIRRQGDTIAFAWTDVGATYRVYRDGQRLYEGTASSFVDGLVVEGRMYDYSIECVQGHQTEVIRIHTAVYGELQSSSNPLATQPFTTMIEAQCITLLWEAFAGVQMYEIYRNNVLVATVKGNRYRDSSISNDQSYTYRIQWHRSLTKSAKKWRNGRLFASNLLFMTERKHTLKKAIERFTVVKQLAPIQQLLRPSEERELTSKKLFKLRYTTFIADPIIQHAHIFSKHHYFQGDHRPFHPEGKTYRTRVDVVYNMTDQKQPITCTRSVGQTVSFSRFGKLRKRGFAQVDGITVRKQKDGVKGFQLVHAVHNPIVLAPHINYEVNTSIEENGLMDVYGWHNEAPHHEVYVTFDQEKWEPIHLVESKGLLWLADLMGVHYWRFSNLS